MEVCLLDALTVVSLRIRQTEKSLLEDVADRRTSGYIQDSCARGGGRQLYILFFVPKRKRNVLQAFVVGNTSNTILSPPVRSGSGMLMREV